jgi:beta,beta-carotene 9',10'-dioxygenase
LLSGTGIPPAKLCRCQVPLTGNHEATMQQLCDVSLEMPRIDYPSHNGRRYRYAYGTGPRRAGDFFTHLAKVDVESGAVAGQYKDNCYPGEPIFVPSPDRRNEDDGVILSVVLDSERESSFLLILDAGAFEEIARVEVPLQIPFDFHGAFYRTTTLEQNGRCYNCP